eukprot:scaffold86641_cov19-Prasinocladus_malaysianus.AAC.1
MNQIAGVFKNADAAYLLAFAIIMLNTDLHNPMVDEKMSMEDFVMMNASANAGLEADNGVLPEGDESGLSDPDGLALP